MKNHFQYPTGNTLFPSWKNIHRAAVRWKMLLAVGLTIVAGATGMAMRLGGGEKKMDSPLPTFTVVKGDLIIDALEPGNIDATESQLIRSEVEGKTTIISIIPEGSKITENDVATSRLLVELDSSRLMEKDATQQIAVQSAKAALQEAKSLYNIQINENESAIKLGELAIKFAQMDIERYLGPKVAQNFIDGKTSLTQLLADRDLAGEALQKRWQMESDINLAKEDYTKARSRLEWTDKLTSSGYLTRDDLLADQLAEKRAKAAEEKAKLALDLFLKYEFMKQAEQYRSDLDKAINEQMRTKEKNASKLAQAEAKLKTNEVMFTSQSDLLEKIQRLIRKCKIIATKPGLVIYAGDPHRGDEIQEGKDVYERQEIIRIPNTASLQATTRVHESVIARVHPGQKAFVTVDAIPDRIFHGSVTRVSVFPDSSNRWMNPNLKVYTTDVDIEDETPALKPGMTAQVQIIIEERKDVVIVPLHAINARNEKKICSVVTANGYEDREVETGEYNDKFIEIKTGLQPGETVLLRKSGGMEREGTASDSAKSKDNSKAKDGGNPPEKMPASGPDKSSKDKSKQAHP
ncbi:MAG: efflux RND transporter periplasmic adaptor subunit [Candidatus Sumerlaeota bacterium]|nr:efflux RND transporter periplasmic adaptor subunit [Candidatus Sumerlaeota bacterium]